MTLADAMDAITSEIGLVSQVRSDPVLRLLVRGFKKSDIVNFDPIQLKDEMTKMVMQVRFDSSAFPLGGTAGIEDAWRSRKKLQGARERLMAIGSSVRQLSLNASTVFRVGSIHIRQLTALSGIKTAKHVDDICAVVLREVKECQETLALLKDEVKDSLSQIDEKQKSLDSWFYLHKEYVFMTSANRGPNGDKETYQKAVESRTKGNLGRGRKTRDEEED